jgi:hypothetical protein
MRRIIGFDQQSHRFVLHVQKNTGGLPSVLYFWPCAFYPVLYYENVMDGAKAYHMFGRLSRTCTQL